MKAKQSKAWSGIILFKHNNDKNIKHSIIYIN
jgi:hypothetical protein